MKIGICAAGAFANETWESACKISKDLGLETIEPSAGGWNGNSHCDPTKMVKNNDEIRNFKATADKYGLEISAFSCIGNPLHPKKEIAEEYIVDLEASMEIASKIGVKVINVFSGLPGAAEDAIYPQWITHPYPFFFANALKWQWEKRIIPFWAEMAKKAKKMGIKFGLEMEPNEAVYNPETVLRLREAVGLDEISCNLDPSHIFYQGIDLEAVTRGLGDAICHVHMKDAKMEKENIKFTGVIDNKDFNESLKRSWHYTVIGYGHDILYWKNFITTLSLIGYDGALNVELQNTYMTGNEQLTKAVKLLKDIVVKEEVKEYWWDGFYKLDMLMRHMK